MSYSGTPQALGTPASGVLTNCTGYPASALPTGSTIQVVNTQTGAVATGTTTIATVDTIPTSSTGDQYMTLAITPTNSSNKLRIEVVLIASSSAATNTLTVALFQDSTANALACGTAFSPTATAMMAVSFSYYMTAGTTSSTTFKVRAGCANSGTTTFNGSGGGRLMGGVYASSITITEIKV